MREFSNNLKDIAEFLKLLSSKNPQSFRVEFLYEEDKTIEIDNLKSELNRFEEIVSMREVELDNFQNELSEFHEIYFRKVGKKLIELEKLKAKLENRELNEEFCEFEREFKSFKGTKSSNEIEVKEFYKKIIKKIHPDLAISEDEKSFREEITKSINEAREINDIDKMQEYYEKFIIFNESNSEIETKDLVKSYKSKILKTKRKIKFIENEIEKFKISDLYELYQIYIEDSAILDKVLNRIEFEIEGLSRC